MKHIFVQTFLLITVPLASGCLRFVPHRGEAKPSGADMAQTAMTGVESALPSVVGYEAFLDTDAANETRLQALLAERKRGGTDNPTTTYQIGAGDLIELKVFKSPELNGIARVRADGLITFPFTGEIRASGLTEQELSDVVRQRLRQYVRNPQTSISLLEYGGHAVGVLGEAAKPGRIPLRTASSTLLKVLGEAGGLSEQAASFLYFIPRKTPSISAAATLPEASPPATTTNSSVLPPAEVITADAIEISLDRLTGGNGEPPLVVPVIAGDTIMVPPAGAVQVDGEVIKPGTVQLTSDTSLLGAIAAAGGLTYSADVEAVELIRTLGPEHRAAVTINLDEVALRGGRDLLLRAGDVIRVPSHSGRFATRQVVNIINNTLRFGLGRSYTMSN